MPFPGPTVDIRAVPEEFDGLIDWFEKWSYRLVLLEEYPLVEVRSAIEAVDRAVRDHRRRFDPWALALRAAPGASDPTVWVVLSDHAWFETSVDQLWWFFKVVEGEDHGGHRQALGQYGRVFSEALRRHRRDERTLPSAAGPTPVSPP